MYNFIIFSDATEPATNEIYDKLISVPLRSAGPYRIATEARNLGLSTLVINFLFSFSIEELQKICEKYISTETILIGFSSTFWFNLDETRKNKINLIANFTKRYPKIKIIIGGTTNYSLKFLKPDYIFNGYSEEDFTKYICSLTKKEHKNEFNFNNSQINYIPEDYLLRDELSVIEIARGCIFKCKFCAFPLNGKKKFDYIKDPYILKDELIKNYELFGITKYQFSDDTLNDSTYKLEQLHNIVRQLPFKINFSAYIRTELIYSHKEQIDLLKEIGLSSAFLGVETFNKKSGSIIGKSMDSEKVKSFLYDLKNYYWGDKIKIIVALISGLPGETEESHKSTLDWILDTKNNLVDRIRANPLGIPNPLHNFSTYKSDFEVNAIKYGFYWPDPKSYKWKNHSYYVKSFDQAYSLSKELTEAARLTDRDTHTTNFLSFAAWSTLSKNPVTFEYLRDLNRSKYKNWVKDNAENLTVLYINYYKDKILNN